MVSVEAPSDENREMGNDKIEERKSVEAPSEIDLMKIELENMNEELQKERRKSYDFANRMKYLQADLINTQKHADRFLIEARAQVRISWIMEIISIKEDLDRALKLSETSDKSGLFDGLRLVSSRIEGILKAEDVKPIEAELGTNFDPSLHEVVAFQDTEIQEQGKIISVISQGYTAGGKVIKPAMVEVARQKSPKKEKNSSEKLSPPVKDGSPVQEEGAEENPPQL
ncbi:MAG: nucleotide exchange factor GrpE [Thaumarchaeota archaeon]|nr:nucleotide exchange factor GrpE [Nitrososphaerota archaeon]